MLELDFLRIDVSIRCDYVLNIKTVAGTQVSPTSAWK